MLVSPGVLHDADRGGSITFHGPGQLVGYPIISVGQTRGDLRGSLTFIRTLQELLIESLEILGVPAISKEGYTGVWVDTGEGQPEFFRYKKLAAIGVKVAQGKTIHGFALNVSTDLNAFEKIIPCGIYEYKATSLEELGYEHISQDEIIETITKVFIEKFNFDHVDIASTLNIENTQATISNFSSESFSPAQPSLRLLGRLSKAGVAVDKTKDRRDRPEWMKNKAIQSEGFLELKKLSKDLKLNTVCEEAGCPNIYECWESKTATFMILGERCTRACSFCLVDTRKPFAPDENEPENVATAIAELKLEFAVITCVARDDLYDDGANQFAETVKAIRRKSPNTGIELLISDCKGKDESLKIIFDEKPDVLNHNIETVARLQKAVRPSASYARSLSVLARAKAAGLKTKSGIIVGMGETNGEIYQTLIDLKNVGVDVVTIGQYLQPTPKHLPVHRFVNIKEFNEFADYGHKIGINHVESGPLVRSSYHAKEAAQGTN
ncbi:MAG: lipoyl synthase [Acidimicrobiia bacterium]